MTDLFAEFIITLLSSAGITGAALALLVSQMLKKAKRDAQRLREERMSLEILRCEGEEASGRLMLALAEFARGKCPEEELLTVLAAYKKYLEKSYAVKNEIIAKHTEKSP